jgi:hypothetical protein
MFYNASKYSRYTKISWSIERIIYRNVSRGLKTARTCKFWIARSKQPHVYNVYMQCINECMGSEFRSIVQPRNYNLRKLIHRRKISFCWSNHFNKWGDITTWKYQLQKFDHYEHQDFVGILSLVCICLQYASAIQCLQLLMHTFFCELFGWTSNNNNPPIYVNQASLHWILKLELQFFELPHLNIM